MKSSTLRPVVVVLVAVAGLLVSSIVSGIEIEGRVAPALQERTQATPGEVVARGRIEPQGGVIVVSGLPDNLSTVAIVDRIMVEQGSKVVAGQVMAILNGYDVSRADLAVSMANLQVARLQRAQLEAGSGKAAEIAAQTNAVEVRRAQLQRIEKDWDRTKTLVQTNAASVQALDADKAALDQSRQELEQAQNALKALTEVRPVDDALSSGQVALAEANLARTRAAMERLEVRAPRAGTVLSIQTHAGELVSGDGILRLGDLDHLIVVAEVDETQIGKVTRGAAAWIEGALLPRPVAATVTRVSQEVLRQKRPSSDILLGRDARIVEVDVTPQQSLPQVIGGEVTVRLTSPAER